MIKKLTFLVLFLCSLGVGLVDAQTKSVSGTVVFADDGEPIIGATVMAKGTTSGTVTDFDGKFEFNAPASATVLVVSYIGMESKEIAVGKNLRISLSSSSEMLDEVMVVAYGTTKKSSFTGSAATVKGEDLQKRKISNVSKALEGTAPGVTVTSGSGQPGEGSKISIRGVGSINASSSPLIVVDGVPYDGRLEAINPEDIENVTVLKDASAGALYGARGANGVILYTTKKGKTGGAQVTLKANFGFSNRMVPLYKTMGAEKFVEAQYSAFYNDQIFKRGTAPSLAAAAAIDRMINGPEGVFGVDQQYNPYNMSLADLIDTTTGKVNPNAQLLWDENWVDEVTRSSAFRHEYNLGISGGSDQTQYMFSLGYLNDNGVLKTTDFQRYSGRAGVESKPKDWFGGGLNVNFSRTETNSLGATGSSTSNVWYSAQLMGPIYPVYEREAGTGNFVLDADGKKVFDYGSKRPSGQQTNFNSVATLYDDKYTNTRDNLSARSHLDFGDTKDGWAQGLKFSVNMGVDFVNNRALTYYNPYFGNAEDVSGRTRKSASTITSYTMNELLSWNRTFGDHTIDALVGHEWYAYEYDYLQGEKTGFPFGGLYQPDAATTVTGVRGYLDKYRIESVFGRVNYDYMGKYYLSFSLRTDGSSRFHKDNRWGTFWSVGGNYRISEEEFIKDKGYDWLDNLSVRASYGVQGNDAILDSDGYADYYPWQSLYDLAYANANESGAMIRTIADPNISWESNSNLNLGMDLSVFERVNLSMEWYTRKTTDMLLYYPLSLSSGFEGYYRNSGSMRNSGLEITITGKLIKSRDLNWDITFMGATQKNKVLKLTDDGADIIGSRTITREGKPYNSFYVVRSAGVDPANGEKLYWANVDGKGNEVDPYITNNTGLAQASRYIAGDRYADFFGSIGTSVSYKEFDFSILTNYSIGGKIYDGKYWSMMSFYYPGQAKHKNYERAWRKPGDITDIPRYEFGKNYPVSDDMLFNASYFKISNITLGYTLPAKFARMAGMKSVRFFATGDNLCIFTHLKGMDPQYSITGGPDYVYSPSRTFAFGFDLKF